MTVGVMRFALIVSRKCYLQAAKGNNDAKRHQVTKKGKKSSIYPFHKETVSKSVISSNGKIQST